MSDLVGNPEDRFSRVEAHVIQVKMLTSSYVHLYKHTTINQELEKTISTDYVDLSTSPNYHSVLAKPPKQFCVTVSSMTQLALDDLSSASRSFPYISRIPGDMSIFYCVA